MKNLILSIVLIIGSIFAIKGYSNEQTPSEMSMIDLSPNKPVHKLFSLTILSINGESVINKNDMMMLQPGKYHLKFASNAELKFLSEGNRTMRSKINQRKYEDSLDLDVEAGNIYHLAFDASSVKVEDWKPVLLRTQKLNQ